MLPLATGLQQIKTTLLRACAPQEAPLVAWPMVCGHGVAEKTEAHSFEEGTLTVIVPDTGWKTELKNLAPQYLAKLNQICPVKISLLRLVTRDEERSNASLPSGNK